MSAPLFSIVSITWQNIDGLRETVESVKSQTFRDFEHIIVDGGSTDGSAEWLAANSHATWVSEPDEGRFDAMNKGSRMSTGEYLWFMNAGDLFGDPEVLARVALAVEREGYPEWFYGMARVVGPDKGLLGVISPVPFSMFSIAILGRSLPHQASAFKRDFFWSLGGYQEAGVAYDQLFMLRAADASPPFVLADFLCDFDFTGVSSGRSWWGIVWDRYKMRRQSDITVTRSRALDNFFAFGYALLQFVGFTLRARLRPKDAVSNTPSEIGR